MKSFIFKNSFNANKSVKYISSIDFTVSFVEDSTLNLRKSIQVSLVFLLTYSIAIFTIGFIFTLDLRRTRDISSLLKLSCSRFDPDWLPSGRLPEDP